MLKVLRVTGNSMSPMLLPRDLILISTKCKNFRPGEVVVFNCKILGLVVKRISSNTREVVQLRGDNPRLDSSVCNKDLDIKGILGKVIGIWRSPFRINKVNKKTLPKT